MEEQLAKYFAGEASEQEKSVVNAWRSENAQNAEMFLEFKETWQLSAFDVVIIPDPSVKNAEEVKMIGRPNYLKYAAAIILLGMIGSIWFFNQTGEEITSPVVFSGSSEVLEDGSTVSLKDGAEIIKMEFSDTERKVFVKGKVFFEVAHNENRPFYVLTEDATVKVLGTSFLVNSDEDYTEVCVESGLVSFSTKSNLSMNLEKGDMGMIGKNIKGVIKRKNSNPNFLSWKDGILTYERTKTIDVIASLEDTYNIQIDAPIELMNCRLTAQYSQKSLEEVIQILSATFSWTYEIDEDKVVLSGEGC